MRQWRSQEGAEPSARPRGSGAGWGGGRQGSGTAWDAEEAPARSNRRNRRPDYPDDVDLERALVPVPEQMAPAMASAGLPALPGYPASDDEERALGIRRPVYIPATNEKKVRPGAWRIVSGVLSVMLICVASCGVAGFLGRSKIETWLAGPVKTHLTPPAYDYSSVPATPTSTPGLAAKYITSAETCRANVAGLCSGPTTKFVLTLQVVQVWVFAKVPGYPAGQTHTVTFRFFWNGVPTGGATASVPGKGTDNPFLFHGVENYAQAGVGMAKVYWDLPNGDSGDSANDPHLAQTVVFGIYAATPTPGTSPTASPGKATATPTKGADLVPAPIARRETSASV